MTFDNTDPVAGEKPEIPDGALLLHATTLNSSLGEIDQDWYIAAEDDECQIVLIGAIDGTRLVLGDLLRLPRNIIALAVLRRLACCAANARDLVQSHRFLVRRISAADGVLPFGSRTVDSLLASLGPTSQLGTRGDDELESNLALTESFSVALPDPDTIDEPYSDDADAEPDPGAALYSIDRNYTLRCAVGGRVIFTGIDLADVDPTADKHYTARDVFGAWVSVLDHIRTAERLCAEIHPKIPGMIDQIIGADN